MEQYFLKIKEIAIRGHVEDEALIEYVIDGIPDEEWNKANIYGTTTLKEFKEKIKAYSKLYRKSKLDSGSTTKKVEKSNIRLRSRKWQAQSDLNVTNDTKGATINNITCNSDKRNKTVEILDKKFIALIVVI